MGRYSEISGIKVLDRAIAIMKATATTPMNLSELCADTGIPRATAHRIASALEMHQILARHGDGRWGAGPELPGSQDKLVATATPFMENLMESTGESVQLYQRRGDERICIAACEPTSGLHNVVPVGSTLTLNSGSAARVLLADVTPDERDRILATASYSLADVTEAAERGWSESIGEREPGLASISAPIFDASNSLVAVLSVSGSTERMHPSPSECYAGIIQQTARELSAQL
ncbi:IclR family transcriptional regulator [Corynebacterium sp. MSK297]|uniref:IclR family transcriptional regulator n=1 Tax=Corynebacterium sp. MSK297 TaxID=3050221 RepID=UPI002551158F|nr:IclR family transcriptional regulator [Corynebacterium sp. MSK297]MDK8846130.1 IclR family transcriptional regulator [Corynebacterium sp. MSK297]